MNFGTNLTVLRKQKGISQENLALSIGVSRQTVYAWECGIYYPNIVMLKRIADTLNVSCDDLIAGIDINNFPPRIDKINCTALGKHGQEVVYEEVPNWFIKLKIGEEANFAMYDNGVKDYSYHLTVTDEITLHDKTGIEIVVDEYDENCNKRAVYSLIAQKSDGRISFIGQICSQNGKKTIQTYKDGCFLENWGLGRDNVGSETIFKNAENCLIELSGKQINAVKIDYFEGDCYFEVFLNDSYESLLWRRYEINAQSGQRVIKNGKNYRLNYICITDRLIKKLYC